VEPRPPNQPGSSHPLGPLRQRRSRIHTRHHSGGHARPRHSRSALGVWGRDAGEDRKAEDFPRSVGEPDRAIPTHTNPKTVEKALNWLSAASSPRVRIQPGIQANGEYPHHSSLFFGCDKVNGGNYWQEGLERGRIASRGPVIESASGKEIIIRDACDWTRPDAPQPLRDTRRIVIRAPSPQVRQIDFTITLEAVEKVVISKTNHSLFSARMVPDLTPAFGGMMVNADGAQGEKDAFGKPSPWLVCFGIRDDKPTEGLAILQHPQNPGFPSPWFIRDYGFFSPTPMFWPADGKEALIEKGGKLLLGYRVLFFSGTAESVEISNIFSRYSSVNLNP